MQYVVRNNLYSLKKGKGSRRLFSSTDIGECSQTLVTSNTALSVTAYSTSVLDSDESGEDTPGVTIPELLNSWRSHSLRNLSVDVNGFSSHIVTPLPVLEGIWKKASELLSEKNAVVKDPGHNDKARMVKSYSGPRPHLVVSKKGGQFACDNTCPN